MPGGQDPGPFFAGLNGGGDAWSAVLEGGVWDQDRYRQALAADRTAEIRLQLVSALVGNYFGSHAQQAEYGDRDTGLAAISCDNQMPVDHLGRSRGGAPVPAGAGGRVGVRT